MKQKKPIISAVLLGLIILGCIGCRFIMTKDPTYMDLANYSHAPNGEFLFGTDTMGRDIFSMIWYGGRISLSIGFLATAISTAIAIVFGAVSGYAPRWLDEILMRLTEIFLSVPELLIIILLQAVIGKATIWSLAFVIGITSLDRHCEDCADRSDSAKEQRICAGGTQYGREFLLYINPPSDTEFYLIDHVYGSYECPRGDRGRIDPEFHGSWPAAGGGILGQYVIVSRSGTAKWSLVDHTDTGCISRDNTDVRDKSRQLSENKK